MESNMSSSLEIDLTCTGSWLSLLKCMSTLSTMEPGDILEVLMQDHKSVESLVIILKRSLNQVLQTKKEGSCYRVCIRKGESGE